MELAKYPEAHILLARLAQSQGDDGGWTTVEMQSKAPTGEHLCRFAARLGMQSLDLFLIAGLTIPADALLFDEAAARELPRLVRRALRLPESGRRRLRDFAQSLTGDSMPQALCAKKPQSYEQYPSGFGSLLVRMLALRNLGWTPAAKVLSLMSGAYLSAATIGAIGRGDRVINGELLSAFAVVLGIPLRVLECLIGLPESIGEDARTPESIDTAALLWDVRNFTEQQVLKVSNLAGELTGE